MKNNKETLKDKLKNLYLEQKLTDEELDIMVDRLAQFFTIGAKMTYSYKKERKKKHWESHKIAYFPKDF